ncbi:MAG TPA: hypothetical protein DIW47_11045, partial [Bacteroidetes bacterium]|nr:hypothetical protein [Bacteroidota bacterium]
MKKQLIKSFEEACKKQGLDPKVLPVVTGLPEKYQQRLIKRYKQMVVTDALNDGWEPDWTDGKWKYYPWMKYTPGVGWSYY